MTAWLDVSAGSAGDMICGSLIDAGAPLAQIQNAVDAVIPGSIQLQTATVTRSGLRATNLTVKILTRDEDHRSWATIRDLLEQSDLHPDVLTSATAIFARLAEAEGRVHGISADQVHFHEVGALDSIADVVGSCAALHALGVGSLVAGPMALGSGHVNSAHGRLPVPVPAVLELVRGWDVVSGGTGELTTPTGAAIVTALSGGCLPLPAMTVQMIGVGAGDRDIPGRPNVVRVVIGTPTPGTAERMTTAAAKTDTPSTVAATATTPPSIPSVGTVASVATVLETNVDDLDPRIWPGVLAQLMQAGAADAWLTPILMKKGRPAHTLSVLSTPDLAPALRAVILRETSAIGLRESSVIKHALDRIWAPVAVTGGTVRVKVALSGGVVVHATPEFDDVAALATASARPIREVLEEAIAATVSAGLATGQPAPPQADTPQTAH
jgi:uncharacterized protein (TIGR00299 family) protein